MRVLPNSNLHKERKLLEVPVGLKFRMFLASKWSLQTLNQKRRMWVLIETIKFHNFVPILKLFLKLFSASHSESDAILVSSVHAHCSPSGKGVAA